MPPDERFWEERALRAAVRAGDDAAWRFLHERFFDPLFAFVHLRTGRRMDLTEEIVQECWLIAVRRIGDFDPARGGFEEWLRGIGENLLKNQLRKERRSREAGRLEDGGAEGVRPGSEPGRHMEQAEEIAFAMSGLPLRYQEVLRAKYGEELRVAEIAARWKETPKAIESLLSRARAAFREAYRRLNKEH